MALAEIAALRLKVDRLNFGLHTLRHRCYAQVPAQVDDGLQDCGVIPIMSEVANEGPIDFDDIDRELLQVRQ